jgi:hypothetical protein
VLVGLSVVLVEDESRVIVAKVDDGTVLFDEWRVAVDLMLNDATDVAFEWKLEDDSGAVLEMTLVDSFMSSADGISGTSEVDGAVALGFKCVLLLREVLFGASMTMDIPVFLAGSVLLDTTVLLKTPVLSAKPVPLARPTSNATAGLLACSVLLTKLVPFANVKAVPLTNAVPLDNPRFVTGRVVLAEAVPLIIDVMLARKSL